MPINRICTCLIRGGSWKDPMKYGLSVLPFCRLFGCFLGIGSLDFVEFWHDARNPYETVRDRAEVV